MADSDHFRVSSAAFKDIPWRTNVVYVPNGLEALDNIAVLTRFLAVIRKREFALLRKHMPVAESLTTLASFCKTGIKPTADSSYTPAQRDAWVKELLGYRLLDIMAQVYGIGVEERTKEKSLTPLNPKLSPQHLDDWPRLIYQFNIALSQVGTLSTISDCTSGDIQNRDPQLIHCYENILVASRRAHKANFLHNLATAGFHLCYLLKGNASFPKDRYALEEELQQQGISIDSSNTLSLEMMQTPLNVALAASPFFLLTNRLLGGLSLGKSKVLEVWELLGNKQPNLVRQAENTLWKAVIEIATTTTPLKVTVGKAIQEINNMVSSNMEACQPHWFRTAPSVAISQPPQTQYLQGSSSTGPSSSKPARIEEEEEDEDEEDLHDRGLDPVSSAAVDGRGPGGEETAPPASPGGAVSTQRGQSPASDVHDPPIDEEPGSDSDDSSSLSAVSDDGRDEERDEEMQIDERDGERGDEMETDDPLSADDDVHPLDDTNSGLRRSSRKRKSPPPELGKHSKAAAHYRKKMKKELKREPPLASSKAKRESQRPEILNYFEEVEVRGRSRLVEVYELLDIVEEPPERTLDISKKARSAVGSSVRLFGPGAAQNYYPAFHHKEDLEVFDTVHAAVQQSLSDGTPLWQADPDKSLIRIVSKSKMDLLSDEDVQAIFETQHIVIPDQFAPSMAFDAKGLRSLAELDKPVTIHDNDLEDYSQKNEFKAESRHQKGTLEDLLGSHMGSLKILNALDFPMPCAPHPPTTISSDLVAFTATLDLPFCRRTIGFPVSSCRWGIAATQDAHHLWHLDCNGFATYIDTQAGAKWWVVAHPKEGRDSLSNINTFSGGYDLSGANDEKWFLEAILLLPGSRLYMRPNTPHFVLTVQSAICHGGHFYAMSAIRDTIFGIYHMFCCSKTITNTEHSKDSHLLICRLIHYIHYMFVRGSLDPLSCNLPPHAPNVKSLEGSLDLFYLCIVAELGELLDPQAYKRVRRNDKEFEEERLAVIYVRGLSREIQAWWCSHLSFFNPASRKVIEGDVVYQDLLSHQIKTLIAYKEKAQLEEMEGEEKACTPAAFKAMGKKYFPAYHLRELPDGATVQDFQWEGAGYTLRKSQRRKEETEPCTLRRTLRLGAMEFDKEFVEEYLKNDAKLR